MKYTLAFLSFVLVGVSCKTPGEHVVQDPELPSTTILVQAESLATMVPVEGTVKARRRAEVSTRMMARISDVLVDVGSPVRSGQALVRLGTEEIAAKRMSADAAVEVAQAAAHEAARQSARMDTLLTQDAVPLVQRDGARLALTQAEAQLAMARSALREVEAAETYATIRAPFDGFVVSRFADVGDLANPGMPILTIEGAGPRDVVLSVPADIAANLESGDEILVSARDGRSASAPVRAVSAGADPRSRTVEVLASLPGDWPTGIAVTALIPSGIRASVLIPAAAVIQRGQLTGVRVVSDDGVLLRWIRLGRTITVAGEGQPARVEVLSGLNAGERIVP